VSSNGKGTHRGDTWSSILHKKFHNQIEGERARRQLLNQEEKKRVINYTSKIRRGTPPNEGEGSISEKKKKKEESYEFGWVCRSRGADGRMAGFRGEKRKSFQVCDYTRPESKKVDKEGEESRISYSDSPFTDLTLCGREEEKGEWGHEPSDGGEKERGGGDLFCLTTSAISRIKDVRGGSQKKARRQLTKICRSGPREGEAMPLGERDVAPVLSSAI